MPKMSDTLPMLSQHWPNTLKTWLEFTRLNQYPPCYVKYDNSWPNTTQTFGKNLKKSCIGIKA